MKTNKISKRIKAAARWLVTAYAILPCAAVGGALVSCSDWDDHFDANTSVLESQNTTLWKNIEKNGNLTQFAEVLRKTGYDQRLDASQTYTVWAPEDGSFDYQTLLGYGNERLVKEFVENHIARNNYPASGDIDKDIYMLNEKKMHFSGKDSYLIQGLLLNQLNMSSSNGTIHTIKAPIPFLSNIYEALLNLDEPVDSIRDYIQSFDEKIINESKSKAGPVVNGEQTFLDTIYYEHNEILSLFDAHINREDSSYTMLIPTNKAWNDAQAKIQQYCNYLPSFKYLVPGEGRNTTTVTLKDAEAMKDSLAKVYMMASLFYNNNLYDNKKLKTLKEGAILDCDSLMTTLRVKMYAEDADNVFDKARRVEMSNGAVWITDSLRIPSWTVCNPEIRFEAENQSIQAHYSNVNGIPNVREVTRQNDEVLGHVSNSYYIELEPQGKSVNPEIYFYLPDIRSTTYNIYLVLVPANINSKYYPGELKPNLIDFTIGYNDEKGAFKQKVLDAVTAHVDSLNKGQAIANPSGQYTAKVDTVFAGEFDFPLSYLGLSSGTKRYSPFIRVRSKVTNADAANYDRTLRIDCIILRPKELDDYMSHHPDYKYDRGDY